MVIARAFVACVLFLAMVGCGADEPAEVGNEKPASGDAPPEGWRWETYRNVRLAVPDDWDYGTTGRQWCGRTDDESPFVGRPGSLRMYACGSEVEGTMLESGGEFVWFGADAGPGAPARVAGRIGKAQMTGDGPTCRRAWSRSRSRPRKPSGRRSSTASAW